MPVNKYLTAFSILTFLSLQLLQAQQIHGTVTDSITHETLIGVNVIDETGEGSISDANGEYTLAIKPGEHTITFSFIGYKKQKIKIFENGGEKKELNINLQKEIKELGIVVVSGSLYEKKLTEETVSIDVIKSRLIQNTNSVNLSDAILKSPGVYMLDEQANIRGGTGFTYGAGSRVMLVVDDQILLAADRGDAKWNFVPMENVQQIEIIKGASSVLYGNSALNGVISVRTAWPTSTPSGNITIYHGFYDKPPVNAAAWWQSNPAFTGISFSHRQKYEKLDLVLGGHFSENNSYLLGQHSTRGRITWKTRFHFNDKDNITAGINGNAMIDREGMFFLWTNPDTGAYFPFGGYADVPTTTLLNWQYKWTTIDPWMKLRDKNNNEHSVKMRFYNNNVLYSDTTGGNAWLANFDYRFYHEFGKDFILTAGATGYLFRVRDDQVLNHNGYLAGAYIQADKKLFSRLTFDVGLREELYKLDSLDGVAVPIFKAGINYRTTATTFIRASFGQGYRFPSLVEKYDHTNVGALNIFPNPDLSAEYGWNAEVGIKKTVFIDAWTGYADVAVYVTDYNDMTEFTFGNYTYNGLTLPGFKSLNTSRARIGGIEFTLNGEGKIFNHTFNFIGGYNYTYPADISADSSLADWNTFTNNFFQGFNSKDSAFLSTVLKYRFRHTLRFDAEYQINKFNIGTDVNYFSAMENVDEIFKFFIPGLVEYLQQHANGDWIFDARVGYAITNSSRVELLVKNIANRMYALRPAKYDPPRNFSIQYKIDF